MNEISFFDDRPCFISLVSELISVHIFLREVCDMMIPVDCYAISDMKFDHVSLLLCRHGSFPVADPWSRLERVFHTSPLDSYKNFRSLS
jgi:hypothetical protein